MAVPKYLLGLQIKQLKSLTSFLGLPLTGRKAEHQAMLSRRMSNPPPAQEFSKILSIDMGIRNLGVCVLEAPRLARHVLNDDVENAPVTVSSWHKMDVAQQLRTRSAVDIWDSNSSNFEEKEMTSIRHREGKDLIAADFTPANLSQTAHSLVTSLLVQHHPTAVLIERQRFRTGGAAAVQEWTVRVNILESMIWACLRTLSAQYPQRGGSYDTDLAEAVRTLGSVREMSPAKVGKFWCVAEEQDLKASVGTAGIDSSIMGHAGRAASPVPKADKIAIAREWVDRWKAGGHRLYKGVALDFRGQAAETAEAFHSSVGKRKTRKRKDDDGAESIGKLDDLADCLLQGVAWVKWEENRRRLAKLVQPAKG